MLYIVFRYFATTDILKLRSKQNMNDVTDVIKMQDMGVNRKMLALHTGTSEEKVKGRLYIYMYENNTSAI